MDRLSIKVDVSKIDKSKITERKYTNKEGVEVIIKELSLDIVPLKQTKVIKEGDTWTMVKTHFVAEPQTKEEKENGQPSVILGDGIMFKGKGSNANTSSTSAPKDDIAYPSDDINPSDIPF